MLEKLRKFSGTVFAKLFLFIVAIPFVFWGMGDLFRGGSQNTIVEIQKEKISTQMFINYIQRNYNPEQKLDDRTIESLLSNFIGEKLLELEIQKFKIELSDESLAKIIRNQETFRKDNKFSRNKYEKFLIENRIDAVTFEKNISSQEEKKQLLNFIGEGVMPSVFIINRDYDGINQKRQVDVLNLNDLFDKKIIFTDDQIKTFFDNNKNSYKTIYKSIKFIELSPNNLIGNNEFSDLFFQKIDQIDDLIVEGKKLNYIEKEYNLENTKTATFNKSGKDKNLNKIDNFPNELINKVFNMSNSEEMLLLEHKDKYFVIEISKSENIQKEITDAQVKKDVLLKLKYSAKRKLISDLISKINQNNLKKEDFDKIAKDNNISVKKINLDSINDDKFLKKELVSQIYLYPEKKVIIATDIGLTENFLVYIDNVKNVFIDKNSKEYDRYLNLSKLKIKTDLFNTYDSYLKNKYKIKINQNALENIKNYF